MSQVEILSGISAHKLRIWERRYNFIKPYRTKTNIRFYSDDQLKLLLNVGILNRNGYRISKIDKMSREEIHEHVTNILTSITSDNQDEINSLVLNMMDYNEKEFQSIFQRCIIRKGFLSTVLDIIYPFLNQIGILWGTNKIIPSQEHFISNLIRQKIVAAIDTLPLPLPNASSITMFLLDNEDHEIGLLLSSFIAKNLGYRVYYFGQRVPFEDIHSFVEKIKPDFMLTMFITSKGDLNLHKIVEKLNAIPDIPLLYSGDEPFKILSSQCANCTFLESPVRLKEYLENKIKDLQ
jgi:DNA-binding transcriptional MerR regulator